MKYKIMRAFPKAKIGNEIRINKELLTEYKIDDGNWITITISIPELISLGWIEEVKARVGWLGSDIDGGYAFYLKEIPLNEKEEWDSFTKWVEVIE